MMLIIDGKKFNTLILVLKYIYGIVPILIGIDKFFYCIVDWNIYVSPLLLSYVPTLTATMVAQIVGVIEIIAGFIILSKWTRFGTYLVAAWLLAIIINLFTIGNFYDIILRDIAIIVGYLTLGMLIDIQEHSRPATQTTL